MRAHLFEFKTDKIDWANGLHVVVAMFVPLIVMSRLGLTQYWASLSLGVIWLGISDLYTHDSPIGYRLQRLGIITLAGVLLTALGVVLGLNWELAVLGTFVVTLLCGACVVWGKLAALAAYLLNIWFLVALSFSGGAAPQALAWLIGGAFYMLLTLIRFKRQPSLSQAAQGPASARSPGSLVATYLALFRFTDPQFQFALIKALAVTLGAAIGLGFALPHANWVPIFTLVVLQPDLEQTRNIFVQRLVGTFLAAALAAVLLGSVHNQSVMALLIVGTSFIANAMHDANMLTYIVFGTVNVLLLIDLWAPGNLTDVWFRMLNVAIGALIAVVVAFVVSRPSQKTEASSVASG
jgi:uncharacterized membrane protein YccC